MNRFPFEIVHRILEYDGRIKYRHGKYMNRIAQDDDRYKMLQGIPQYHSITSSDGSFSQMILLNNAIFFTKHFHASFTGEKPIIERRNGRMSSSYIYTKDGISCCWTIRHKDAYIYVRA